MLAEHWMHILPVAIIIVIAVLLIVIYRVISRKKK